MSRCRESANWPSRRTSITFGKGWRLSKRRHFGLRQTFVLPEGKFAGQVADPGGDGSEHPLHDPVGDVAADDQERPALEVGSLAPPHVASGYHHLSHGSSLMDSTASRAASRSSSSVSGPRA